MERFGGTAYTHTVYINFDSTSRMAELFASESDMDALKQYYFVGGMLEAEQSFAKEKNFPFAKENKKIYLRTCTRRRTDMQ